MTKMVMLTCVMLLLAISCASARTMTSGRPSAVLSKHQCKQVWKQAVHSGRYLARADAYPYIVNFMMADGPDQDGKISRKEFKHACSMGLVKNTP